MDYGIYGESVSTWIEKVQKNRGINAGEVLKYGTLLEEYAEKHGDAGLLGFACFYVGETYYLLNDGERFLRYITRAISYLDESGQWEQAAEAYNILAITSLNRGNAPVALDYYLTGLNYCKKYGLTQQENRINLNVGTLYLMNGQQKVARKYFERVKAYAEGQRETEEDITLMTCICVSLGRCYLAEGKPEMAQQCLEEIEGLYWERLLKTEQLYVLLFKSRFYYSAGKIALCEECIEKIHQNMNQDMAIMDIFDDFYDFGELLLDMDQETVFWDMIKKLEKMTKSARIINLQRKIISLKIKWYRKQQDRARYLQATGRYYELTEIMERENQYMITNMLKVRNSLESANEMRREAEDANARLLKKSETDALTHLANRFRLEDYFAEVFEKSVENHSALAVEILDIDYFKEYNDNYGHQAGDNIICAIAGVLNDMQQRDGVFCARYGGDEFIIIYQGMSEEEVFDQAEKLRRGMMELNLEHAYSKAFQVVTISQGICFDVPQKENKSWDFLHAADVMLYTVKRRHKNNFAMGSLREAVLKEGSEIAAEPN